MKTEPPFPPWEVMASWLAGQGAAVLLIVIVSLLWVRRFGPASRGRRRAALAWGFASTVMPVAWLVARWLPGWVAGWVDGRGSREFLSAFVIATALHGLAAGLAIYLSDLGDQSNPDRGGGTPEREPRPSVTGRDRTPVKQVAVAPLASSGRKKPTLAAPPGATVAARARPRLQADGLIRVLSDGSSMQRAAAAKALALSFADTAQNVVMDALIDVVADLDADDESRVEAWIAACKVMGDPLPWAAEEVLRRDGPDEIDPAHLLLWREQLEDAD